ncbi:hypothetical protein [Streptomyces aureocirculatus]|uniref:hypothetical protein n=1 Tax=Streptomyces aureocirculatus TaxID=67275 RepID=UPI00068CA7EB|nr:hypothetical protein [Streptomyces aureocirculatus]
MHHEHDHEHKGGDAPKSGHTSHEHAETAVEEIFDEVEDAETRLPGTERDKKKREQKDGEAGDTLTPSPTAQEDARRDH